MQVYIVGGAVRDQVMKRPYSDKDFVVVGVTPQQMLDAGFIQVGADFPVFLHPKTKCEYALARTERKCGKGYKGFEVYASPEVTIEEDLLRRDLTINAMAIEVNSLTDDTPKSNHIIDPYGGCDDIKNRILRHVSDAFSEDPLRVLRIARFYGRFFDTNTDTNFSIHPDTLALINEINQSGELKLLTKERVWQETSRAIMQQNPQAYFACLMNIGSLNQLMPNLSTHWQNNKIKLLVFETLKHAGTLSLSLHQRWAIIALSFAPFSLLQSLFISRNLTKTSTINDNNLEGADNGTYATENKQWQNSIKELCVSLKVPKRESQFALLFAKCFSYLNNMNQLTASEINLLIEITKAHKEKADLNDIISLHNLVKMTVQQLDFANFLEAYHSITINDIDRSLNGSAIGEALTEKKIQAIYKFLKN